MLRNLSLTLLLGAAAVLVAAEGEGDAKAKASDSDGLGTVIGIDLGTTYSCVAVFKNGRSEIIPNDQGNRITPSYVAFTDEGRLVGDAAKNQLTSNPENTVFDVKRLIGRDWADKTVQRDKEYFPFELVERNGRPQVEVQLNGEPKVFTPEEISAMVLTRMKESAEQYLGETVTHAVVTVPAYFNDAQRQATKDAGAIAGLTVLRIINEPTAAAIAYGLEKSDEEKTILVFDLGGGTFDVSLLTIDNGVFEVLSTNGDTHLGGEDFDQRVIEYFSKLYQKKKKVDIKSNKGAVQKLRREVEKAKRMLSTQQSARVEIENFIGNEDFSETITRARFEELNLDLFRSTLKPVKKVLADGDLKKTEVDEIVLVGGSTRIPKVRSIVRDFFNGKEPTEGINPDEAVAYGAAVQAGVLGGEEATQDLVLLDVNPLTLGMETTGGVMTKIIERNTAIPTKKSMMTGTDQDNAYSIGISIYEGERTLVADNHLLGRFDLVLPPKTKRGELKIEVTLELDVNGVIRVSAEDKGESGKKDSITISNKQNRLTKEDIESMIKDAEKFADEDKMAKEKADARNELEGYVYGVKNKLNDPEKLKGQLDADDVETVMGYINEAIDWLDTDEDADAEDISGRLAVIKERIDPLITAAEDKIEGAKALAEEAAKDKAREAMAEAGIVAEEEETEDAEEGEKDEDRFSDEL